MSKIKSWFRDILLRLILWAISDRFINQRIYDDPELATHIMAQTFAKSYVHAKEYVDKTRTRARVGAIMKRTFPRW